MKLPKNIMVIDTETIGLSKRFAYDIGYVVATWNGKSYELVKKEHFIIKQVFRNKELFETAYYAEKRPKYVSLLKGKSAKQKYLGHAFRKIRSDMKKYNVTRVFAYNSPFDNSVFQFNSKYFKIENPIKSIQWYDIKRVAHEYIHNTRQYRDFVKEHDRDTEKGYIKTNAETTYASIKNNSDFKEEHMGLQDCLIELDILNECIKLGYQGQPLDRKNSLIPSEKYKEHKIIKNNKTYAYKYKSMKNTKNGLILN